MPLLSLRNTYDSAGKLYIVLRVVVLDDGGPDRPCMDPQLSIPSWVSIPFGDDHERGEEWAAWMGWD